MLYDKWRKLDHSTELFKNPPREFRGAPFWAWNSALDPKVLADQVDIFAEMGFGGFNMHVRQGLETPYLGPDFFKAVKSCVARAEETGLTAWLYDEDRWPSGAAGGFATKTPKTRVKALALVSDKMEGAVHDYHDAIESGAPVFVAAFSLDINEDGLLVSYKRVSEDEECENKRYFYCITARGGEPRYNMQAYLDTLSRDAVDHFKQITYEAFKREVGEDFGKSIPAIFTDEPQTVAGKNLKSGFDKKRMDNPWTWDFHETFKQAYGFDLTERLPEIFYRCVDESDMSPRYYYFRHLADRFAESFIDNLGNWCEKNNIMFTGHLMQEDSLIEITNRCFDPMRMYKSMQLPGIDVLYDRSLFTTAKQCESVVRQTGKIGMLSEMYGVTNWDYDFRGHKSQGDWQACLGVTVRVPHLSWQTMKGEGKRDYPASIFYQSPWYKEYKIIEDHYARVNTALTRGKACSNVAVLHPIESFYMRYASRAESSMDYEELNRQFTELCGWLLLGSVNFDYVAESLMEELCKNPTCPLKVGEMEYDTVVLDNCENLRPYTIKALKDFAAAGGKLIISGRTPYMSLAKLSDEAKALCDCAEVISHTRSALLRAIAPSRDVVIKHEGGELTEDLLYTRRTEGDVDWLFVCNAYKPELLHIPAKKNIEIIVNGLYRASLYNTENGEIEKISWSARGGKTKIKASLFDFDSLLIKLEKLATEDEALLPEMKIMRSDIYVPSQVDYKLSEPNALILDMPEWSVDGGRLYPREELMRIDEKVRNLLNLPLKRTKVVQPWAVKDEPEKSELYLKFTFNSEVDYSGATLALENLHKSKVVFNGTAVDTAAVGYYVDREIHTCALPDILRGENILEITMPFGIRTDAENCFVLGNFGTAYKGSEAYITTLPEKLHFGDVTRQGLAFYGADITYDTVFSLNESTEVEFELSYYRGALIRVDVDGKEAGYIWKSPFRLVTDLLGEGEHNVSFTVFGNRYNTFAALHTLLADKKDVYTGPDYWRSTGFGWSYEYNTRPFGILKTPVIRKYKEET